MTLGLFLPLAFGFIALTEIPIFIKLRSTGAISEAAFPFLALASLILPFALYVVLNILVPEWGAIVLF
ncbi:hypothetical protein [Altererythrobacter lutimaris]|uniref:Uncharacterized protein n=1 Tax=Altererythrobacter lutimaris TaxID=2743979 RepID=A0A850HDG1_9SPHN|nr:hypothetical protein [Altererythrobacter lutimaris]NVE95141.1 hypothetical protein [Altererythrobacter lutimaris]